MVTTAIYWTGVGGKKKNVKTLPWGNTEIQIVQNTKIQTLAEKLVTIAMVTTAKMAFNRTTGRSVNL